MANYLGHRDVLSRDLLTAIDMLRGERTLDDLGRPQSPLVSRVSGAGSGADPAVRALAQRWFARLDSDVGREFDEVELAEFVSELRALSGD